jgi:hypothetical protein
MKTKQEKAPVAGLVKISPGLFYSVDRSLEPRDGSKHELHFNAKIYGTLADGQNYERRILGTMEVTIIRGTAFYDQSTDPWSIFDSEGGLAEAGEMLINFKEAEYKAIVSKLFGDAFLGDNFIHIQKLKVSQAARRQKLGLLAMRTLISDWGETGSLAVLKPFPLQFASQPTLSTAARGDVAARKKLSRYYELAGFRAIGKTGFMGLCCAEIQPGIDAPEHFYIDPNEWEKLELL